ncbi:O-sialoglycoprotein endopeptidase [Melia azedarach]|uniref:O-sialoglycoprotein endopeptidase n=1 Tax=Melia azedarach TaxID=155640 RepID=A0ACC1YVG0_MELAZ|nr:O-sialoglycoprotein endopeptidase [Melia azedarach]
MSSLQTLSSRISRLNLLQKPSLTFPLTSLKSLKTHERQTKGPTWSPLRFSPLSNRVYSSKNVGQIKMSAKEDLIVLGIETSCDDTAAAVVRGNGEILSQVVSSQADLLVKYGGVAPKMAEEAHSQAIDLVVKEALNKANLTERDLSAVAVTVGPGLSLCLRVGVAESSENCWSLQSAHCWCSPHGGSCFSSQHLDRKTQVNYYILLIERDLQFPFLALLISGGHNLLVLAHNLGHYTQLGTTIDDAIGEAFDKTAKWLGLDMRRSGGPAVEELALEGDAESVKFSTPMQQHKDCNFSYAGLKTQVRLAIESRNIDAKIPISSTSSQERNSRANVAASFQRVAVLHLEERCERAIGWALKIEPSIKHLVVSGGVASNKYVRTQLEQVVKKNSLQLVCPPPCLCTDNGVMVAWTGVEHFCVGRFDPPPPANEPEDFVFDLRPRWPLGEEYAEGRSDARSLRKARVHPSLTSMIQASMQQ